MFKSPITKSLYSQFISDYQSLKKHKAQNDFKNAAYVYVDDQQVRLLADVMSDFEDKDEGIFAVSIAQDGWMELLAISE